VNLASILWNNIDKKNLFGYICFNLASYNFSKEFNLTLDPLADLLQNDNSDNFHVNMLILNTYSYHNDNDSLTKFSINSLNYLFDIDSSSSTLLQDISHHKMLQINQATLA